jgi:predicted transcriptional regulator
MATATGLSRRIWTLLLEQGGWWSSLEISAELDTEFQPVSNAISALREHKSVISRGPNRFREYAVTRPCIVPRGLSVDEVIRLGGAK